MSKRVYVFASNEAGRHESGDALTAYKKHGARYGFSYGHMGFSFAIPTRDQDNLSLSGYRIFQYVQGFKAYAAGHPELTFQVTQIGTGLADYDSEDVAFMFTGATNNCLFDDAWEPYLGEHYSYWGTSEP